jgi:hypothetical protein
MLRENREMDKEMCVLLAIRGCPKQLHIVQKVHHTPKSKGQKLRFQALTPDCVREMTEPAQGENENDSWDDGSLASDQQYRHHRHPDDRRWRNRLTVYKVDSGNIKQFKFHELKNKRKKRSGECVQVVQNTNEEKKPVLYARLAVWNLAKLSVSSNITRRKITQQIGKNCYDSRHLR